MAFSRFPKLNLSVGQEVSFTTLATSVSYDGVTFSFDRAMPVGAFVTGDPFVISDQPFAITSISPEASDIQGDGYIGNGAMRNRAPMSAVQGFDAYLSDYPNKTTFEIPYDPTLNIDPAVSGSITFAPGERATITKSVRAAGLTSPSAQHQAIDKYVHLTVLETAPPQDSYRPGHAGTEQRIRSRSDINFTPRGIPLPPSWPSIAEIISNVPTDLGFYSGGETHRRLRLDNALGTTNDGYSGEIIQAYAQFVYAVNSSTTSDIERQTIIDRIITFSNDVESVVDAGANVSFGAGQGGGIWLWVMAAAALLKDGSLHQKIRGKAQPDRSPLWVTPGLVGQGAGGKVNVAAQTYFDVHVGDPWMQPDEFGSHHSARYLMIASHICAWEYTAILAFAQGSGDNANGADMILNGGTNDANNVFAAGLNHTSRYRSWQPAISSAYSPTPAWKDAWDDISSLGEFTPWTGHPDQPPTGDLSAWKDPYFTTGGAGAIVLNTQGVDFATEAVTRVDFRYSLDGVQWIEDNDISFGGTVFIKDGLLRGARHYCGWRRHSASGPSAWSQNHPFNIPLDSGDDRGVVTTTGSEPDTAPANTVQPTVHARTYPAWGYPVWTPLSGTMSPDAVQLSAGLGYWSGFPAPNPTTDFAFQWKRNGTNIDGATQQIYIRTAADAAADLTCEITCTTQSGVASATTPPVTAPDLAVLPTGTLIDTNFRGTFAIDYEPEFNSRSGSSYDVLHEPLVVPIDEGESFGALHFRKTGAWPSGGFALSRAAEPNTTYSVTAQVAYKGTENSSRGDFKFSIEDSSGTVLFTQVTPGTAVEFSPSGNLLVDISDTFAVGAEVDLKVKIGWGNSTGGPGGGDPYLTRLQVTRA